MGVEYYQGIFQHFGGRGSALTVFPFNQGSKQDVEVLVYRGTNPRHLRCKAQVVRKQVVAGTAVLRFELACSVPDFSAPTPTSALVSTLHVISTRETLLARLSATASDTPISPTAIERGALLMDITAFCAYAGPSSFSPSAIGPSLGSSEPGTR